MTEALAFAAGAVFGFAAGALLFAVSRRQRLQADRREHVRIPCDSVNGSNRRPWQEVH